MSKLYRAVTEHAPLPMATVEGASHKDQLVGKSFCDMLPEKAAGVTLLDRVFRTGKPESHMELEHSEPPPVFWSYTAWSVMGNERPVGVIIQVTESREFHEKTLAMTEALILGSVRQHELTEAADSSNTPLQEEISERKRAEEAWRQSKEDLDHRVVERTVETEEDFISMDLSNFTVSFMADDILRLRYVSINGQLRKMLLVVKMRRSEHSIDMVEYQVTSKGIVIGEPLRGYRGLTSGIPSPWSLQSDDFLSARRDAKSGGDDPNG